MRKYFRYFAAYSLKINFGKIAEKRQMKGDTWIVFLKSYSIINCHFDIYYYFYLSFFSLYFCLYEFMYIFVAF